MQGRRGGGGSKRGRRREETEGGRGTAAERRYAQPDVKGEGWRGWGAGLRAERRRGAMVAGVDGPAVGGCALDRQSEQGRK